MFVSGIVRAPNRIEVMEHSMLLTAFLICLGWGVLASPFLVLVKIGAKPVPKPPDPLRHWNLAAYSGDQMGGVRLVETLPHSRPKRAVNLTRR